MIREFIETVSTTSLSWLISACGVAAEEGGEE